MKKLIVAAAVAVVAGGAFALDGYDFTATLKTTQGKMQGARTQTYYLGVDQMGNFWYDDTSITNLEVNIGGVVTNIDLKAEGYAYAYFASATNTDTKTIKGVSGIKSLKLVNTKGTPVDSAGYLAVRTAEQEALVVALAAKYNQKSAGVWCETVKIDSAGCYRVAGSAKISYALYTTNCCEIAGASFTNTLDASTRDYHLLANNQWRGYWGYPGTGTPFTNVTVTVGIEPWFIQRFGSLTSAGANKAEMVADVLLPTTADGRWFEGTLAGQGTWANGRVATVSGNIVGQMDPAICPHCCVYPVPAVAFDCDDTMPDGYLTTAAFGTFRFKYNSKLK